ncbi:MAG: septal ring lytic transglycosylase RlpA family protein [Phormidesmis priestleyi]|uniref:Probable endolytic peptidoglycan transglycosylase RlpA n=1 Tax=Phormidesmis priestleyi TaxID=268141 RepID=A0A2W4Z5Q3_9CYAN|nr:MAG: septal ring lytic transglycosylase RlpA family protein [Phormidesmis priestleyi]
MLLFNDSIKRQFTTSLAAAVLLSAASASLANAQIPNGALTEALSNSFSTQAASANEALASSSLAANTSASGTSGEANHLPASSEFSAVGNNILVYAHSIDGRQAATLYVKNIPVLTFIGTEVSSLSNRSDTVALAASRTDLSLQTSPVRSEALLSAAQANDPISRATALGAQLSAEGLSAEDLSVRWNEASKGFTVTLANSDLVALDSRTVLADTTQNPAEDALQVTNRLRRLIGSATPITEIEGMPEPVVEVAPVQTVAIVSSTTGSASWYGPGFNGRLSASGEVFNQNALTAAHRTLPFGTKVLVTNLANGRQVTVRINDRGPYSGHRVIDLSAGAADAIGLISAGTGTVQLDVLAN